MKRVYDESQAEVARKLARLVRSGQGDTFTAFQQRQVIAQLRQGQGVIMERMKGELADAARDTMADSLHALVRDLSKLERHFSGAEVVIPVEDAAQFAGVIDDRAPSLMRRYEPTMNRYGARVVAQMENVLAKSVLKGETPTRAIDRIQEVADLSWPWGERIVRTELAHAANASHADGIKAAREVLPDLYMQWQEFVSVNGRPLDSRVGVDSLAMHLQVAKPGEMFICPPRAPDGQKVSDALAYETVEVPPLRPNGREVIVPWRPSWDLPGWRFIGGRRVQIR